MKRIGFIGAGKVGFSFGRHINENGGGSYCVAGYFSRTAESARAAAAFTGSRPYETPEALAADCDLLLLTVPDSEIEILSAKGTVHLAAPLIAHCSGILSGGSIHPMIALHDRETAYKALAGAYFTIEGGAPLTEFTAAMLKALGNPFCRIEPEQKPLYHAASVMVSNLVCGLTYEGIETLKLCGLSEDFAERAWRSLFLGNAETIAALGPAEALTGPVERGDGETVAHHLDALTGKSRELYRLLSYSLLEPARQKNPGRDYTELARLLDVGAEGQRAGDRMSPLRSRPTNEKGENQ